jgi:hypothetical protein
MTSISIEALREGPDSTVVSPCDTDTLPFALAEQAQPRDWGGWNHFTGFIVIGDCEYPNQWYGYKHSLKHLNLRTSNAYTCEIECATRCCACKFVCGVYRRSNTRAIHSCSALNFFVPDQMNRTEPKPHDPTIYNLEWCLTNARRASATSATRPVGRAGKVKHFRRVVLGQSSVRSQRVPLHACDVRPAV